MATATKATPAKAPNRRILVNLDDGRKMLIEDIPANAKVTFGKLQPGPNFHGQNALRIYTVESNQLAVFCDVSSFRDLSLTVKEQSAHRRLRENAKAGPNGSFSDGEYTTEYAWEEVNLDSPPAKVEQKLRPLVQSF